MHLLLPRMVEPAGELRLDCASEKIEILRADRRGTLASIHHLLRTNSTRWLVRACDRDTVHFLERAAGNTASTLKRISKLANPYKC